MIVPDVTNNLPQDVDVDAFTEALNNLSNMDRKPGPACGFGQILGELTVLSPALAEAAVAAVDNPRVVLNDLAKYLTGQGFPIRAYTVSRHRKRGEPDGCRCPR